MKKILSAVLAAAMVLSMGVMAFAADYTWGSGSTGNAPVDVDGLYFKNIMRVVHANGDPAEQVNAGNNDYTFTPGDDLYFPIMKTADDNNYANVIDKNWSINIKANDFVEKASFYTLEENKNKPWGGTVSAAEDGYVFVKVEIADDYDNLDSSTVNFYMYLANNKTKKQSNRVDVKYGFDNIVENYVDFDFTNDADHAAKWVVKKNEKGRAVFDFDDGVYFSVNMVSEEKVILNLSQAYDKDIDREYNEYDADLSFYNFKGDNDSFIKTGELFIPSAKENKYIYEVIDGELVEVDAEYNSAYKVANVGSKKGYVIETKELGYYVVADEELIVSDEDIDLDDDTTSAPVEDNKVNPPMGANDFVGAAVALAVVSVAAAGALALKK